jgi:hypothetical protein
MIVMPLSAYGYKIMSEKHWNATHGMSKTSIYSIWRAMLDRCNLPSNRMHYRYGNRGICVCHRWSNKVTGFLNFYNDMGERPSNEHSIDRIDNDGNYTPSNVRWATYTEQARNSSSVHLITWNNYTACLAEWAEITGLHYLTILKRLKRGWTIDRTVRTPVSYKSRYAHRPNARMIEFNGKTKSLSEWAREFGITQQSLSSRIKKYGVNGTTMTSKTGKRLTQ